MKRKIIPQTEPFIGEAEIWEVAETIKNKWISGGPKLQKFQKKIAGLCGVKHAIGVCNGTQALYVGLMVLGISPGDEVIVPDFTFIASANAVTWTGAKPVFVDIDRRTFNIDPTGIKRAITKKTKAIMPVHIYGQAADMDAIMKIAQKHNLLVIEDAAQGIGVSFKGKPVGGFGQIGCLSFYADKVITTGEGGMVLTNDDDLARKAVILLNQGRTGRGWYIHDYLGYNFRLTDIQAAVGLAQVRKLTLILRRRARIERLYQKYLKEVKEVSFPFSDPRGRRVLWRMIVLVEEPEKLSAFLEKRGIKTARSFYPLHQQPCYQRKGVFPNTQYAYERILRLPSGTGLTDAEIKYVCNAIKAFFSHAKK